MKTKNDSKKKYIAFSSSRRWKMHYNKEYFEWQKNVGALGGVLNRFKFEAYIAGLDTVIDFGCGGGILIKKSKL